MGDGISLSKHFRILTEQKTGSILKFDMKEASAAINGEEGF